MANLKNLKCKLCSKELIINVDQPILEAIQGFIENRDNSKELIRAPKVLKRLTHMQRVKLIKDFLNDNKFLAPSNATILKVLHATENKVECGKCSNEMESSIHPIIVSK